MTGSASDPLDWQPHIRNKPRREGAGQALPRRQRTRSSSCIVRDMWLTGFDAPSLHTMYVDKPMRGHGLMQAIARVNRVFRDKPGGLVVDYLGLAHELKQALATYTESGGTGGRRSIRTRPSRVMLEKYEVCCGLFHGFDWSEWMIGTPAERLRLLPPAQEHILAQEDGKDRLLRRRARAVAGVRAGGAARRGAAHPRRCGVLPGGARGAREARAGRARDRPRNSTMAVRQIVSRAVASEGVVDIFAAAGLKKPDISILSDEFLAEVRGMPQRNLAVELLRKLSPARSSTRRRKNVVQARSFAEMLEQSIRRYQNRAIEAAQVIEELIALAKDMRAAERRGEELGSATRSWPSTTRSKSTTARCRCSATNAARPSRAMVTDSPHATSRIDWTCARTCARSCASSSSASCGSTAIRRTSRRRRRRR